MRRTDTQRRTKSVRNQFNRVFDGANRKIRGLWQRNGVYYAQVRAGVWRGRVALEHAQSVPEATTAAQVLKSEIQAGTFKPPQPKGAQTAENGAQKKGSPDSTLTEAITAYEADTLALKTKDPKTLKHEGCAGRRWTEFAGDRKLSEVDAKLLKDFTKHRRKTVGTRSVNTNVLFLHHVLDWCVVEGWLPRFPDAWAWKDLPEDPATVRLLTVEELEFIAGANLWTPEQLALIKQPHTRVLRELDAASGRRFQDYVKLLAWSGGREQETCKQKWSNVDWKVGLQFPGQVAKKGAGRPSPDRWVHWNPRLEAHLRDMETRRDPTTDYMFPGEVDRQEVAGREVAGHQGSFRKQWENACEKLEAWHISKGETPDRALELADIGFHVTRHFFISFAVSKGVPLRELAAWVGHKDGGFLISTKYAHLVPGVGAEAGRKLTF